MKASRIAGALALLLVAGGARAQSFIPGNNVDSFGPFTYSSSASTQQEQPLVASRWSPLVAANNVDDFGPMISDRVAAPEEFGAAGGEPAMVARAAERAQEKAALDAYNREQFLRNAVWSPLP